MTRIAEKTRQTKETDIKVKVNLDGTGNYSIQTPNNFFNHMLEQLAKHSNIDIELVANSLDNNFHHLIEDCAIILGQALNEASGNKRGIKRYSSVILPMDEALILCALDFSGRAYLRFNIKLKDEKTADFETVLLYHFFNSLATNSGMCLHLKMLDGIDTHHIIEATFKAFAKALGDCLRVVNDLIPSTKGVL